MGEVTGLRRGSGIGEDGLRSDPGAAVNGSGPDETAIVEDLVLGSPRGGAPGAGHGLPTDTQGVSGEGPFTVEDCSGDHPLDDHVLGAGAAADRYAAGVFGADGVDTVDHVASQDPGALLELRHRQQTRAGEEDKGDDSGDPGHGAESKNRLSPTFRVILSVVAVLVAAVMAFAIFEPIQVLPRIRLAPGFAFTDQFGGSYTSEDGRGAVTLYTFTPTTCGAECDSIHQTMRDVRDRVAEGVDLAGADFNVVTVALDTAEPALLAAAAADAAGGSAAWRWVGGDGASLRDVVGGGFGVYFDVSDPANAVFDPTFVIVDGEGLIRGEYTYSTLVSDAERLTRHISLLGEEIAHAEGNTALLYEAAHVFLCYP